jgi:hypothetical protein
VGAHARLLRHLGDRKGWILNGDCTHDIHPKTSSAL